MPILNNGSGNFETVRDALKLEENVFLMKLIRDKLQAKSDESKNTTFNDEDIPVIEKPKPPECRLKRTPERPVFDEEQSKLCQLAKKLFFWGKISGAALLVDFVAVVLVSDFFAKSLWECGFLGTLLLFLVILTVPLLGMTLALRTLETTRFNSDFKSWVAIKEQIDEYNCEEMLRVEEETKLLNEEYEKALEAIHMQRLTEVQISRAKAAIFELQRAKLTASLFTAEKQRDRFNSKSPIPQKYRRLDSLFMLSEYLHTNGSLDAAISAYNEAVADGSTAQRLSDIMDNREYFMRLMPEFTEFLTVLEQKADSQIEAADNVADGITRLALNIETGELNMGIVSNTFRTRYDESELSCLMNNIIAENESITSKY